MSTVAPPLDLRPDHLGIVRDILRRHVPDRKVLAFGSRATWTAKEYSDLDLAILGDELLPLGVAAAMADDFSESDLPFKVDLVDWVRLDESFRDIVCRDQVVVQVPARHSEFLVDAGETLGENVEIVMGQSPPGEKCNKSGDGIPLLNGPTEYGSHHPHPVQFTTDARKIACAGDILFCVRGSTGRMNWADQVYAIGRGIAAIRHKKGLGYQTFVRAVIEYHLPDIMAEATGSVFSNVSHRQLANLRWPSFELSEQLAIAHILGTLDDKIELNRRMNETLEATARAIFKDWFIDFGPTRAKMEGRDPYLPPETWDLFPDVLDNEGKPMGWKKDTLGAIFDVSIGRTPPRKESHHFMPGGKGETWLSIKTMGNIQTFAIASEEDLTPNAVDQFRVPLIPSGTVLVSFKLTVGRVAIAGTDMYSNEAIAHLVENERTPISNLFTYCFMKDFDYGSLGSTSSIATAVNSKTIKDIEMTIPDNKIHEIYFATVKPIFDQILANLRENDTLIENRELLLPRLISGEICVNGNKIIE